MFALSVRVLVMLVACGWALAACGGQSAAERRVLQTITEAFHALGHGDGAALCGLSTPQARHELARAVARSSCPAVVRFVSAHLTPAQRLAADTVRVNRVVISGDTATVGLADLSSARGSLKGFYGSHSPPTRLRRRSDGVWRISG